MLKALINIVRFACYVLLLACSAKLYAEQEWRIVLLPQNTSTLTSAQVHYPASISKFYNTVIEQSIAEQLLTKNFEVLDKSFLPKNITENRFFPDVKENLEHIPNLAIRYQLTITQQAAKTYPKWHYQLLLNVVDLMSKNTIETHSENFIFSGVPDNCNKNCLQQWLNKWAGQLSRDAGAVLVKKLMHLPRRYYYRLTFNDFSVTELNSIQLFISNLPSTVFSELTKNLASTRTLIGQTAIEEASGRQYRYVSLLPADELDVLLNEFFINSDLNMTKASSDGENFNFIRSPTITSNAANILAIVIAILLFSILVLLVYRVKTKHEKRNKVLKANAFEKSAEQLIQKLNLLKSPEHVYQALSLIDYFILQYKNNHKIQSETQDKDQIKERAKTSNTLLIEKLMLIRAGLIKKIAMINGNVKINHCYIYQQNSIEIGLDKNIESQSPEILLSYLKLSEVGHQAKIIAQHGHFYCVNQDSNDLSLFNNQTLPLGMSQLITHQDTLTLAVSSEHQLAPCQFIFWQCNNSLMISLNNALPSVFEEQELAKQWPTWQQDIKKQWLLQQSDLAIVLDKSGRLSFDDTSTIAAITNVPATHLQKLAEENVLAWLSYDQGYYLTPSVITNNEGISTPLVINNVNIYQQVPVTHNCQITIAGQAFNLSTIN